MRECGCGIEACETTMLQDADNAERVPACRPSAGHSVPQCRPVPTYGRALRAQYRPSAGTPCPSAGQSSAGTPCLYSAPVPALLPCPQCPESPSARAGQCRTAAAGLAAFTRR